MVNQEAILYLGTPLLEAEPDNPLLENIHRVKGKILGFEPVGVLIQVKSFGNSKRWYEGTGPFHKILVPTHKIDFIAVV